MRRKLTYCILIFATIFFTKSCKKPETYSIVPEITFQEFSISGIEEDGLGNPVVYGDLVFDFIDGDGDIGSYTPGTIISVIKGVEEADSTDYDLYMERQIKEEGEYKSDSIRYHYIPYFKTSGRDKSLKGNVIVRTEFFVKLKYPDTFRYKFYMYDREKHLSNKEVTPDIFINIDSLLATSK